MNQEVEKNIALLQSAIAQFNEFYVDEAQYVRTSAAVHRIVISGGNILEAPTPGTYSPRTPDGNAIELKALLTRNVRIAGFCEDYRQAADFAESAGARVFIGTAGGAAQPDEGRFSAMVKLFSVINQVNPTAVFILGGHDDVCGGANFFTGGAMEVLREKNPNQETNQMRIYIRKLGQALIARGVKPENIELRLARVQNKRMVAFEKIEK